LRPPTRFDLTTGDRAQTGRCDPAPRPPRRWNTNGGRIQLQCNQCATYGMTSLLYSPTPIRGPFLSDRQDHHRTIAPEILLSFPAFVGRRSRTPAIGLINWAESRPRQMPPVARDEQRLSRGWRKTEPAQKRKLTIFYLYKRVIERRSRPRVFPLELSIHRKAAYERFRNPAFERSRRCSTTVPARNGP